jgi:DNA-binding transcriptional LysR family regulator
MDIVLLKTFLNVLASESFVGAADRMFVTQSAISVRIQKLEDTLGQRLFQRSKSGVSLTPDGAKFEPYARSALQLWDEAVYQVSLRDGITGSLSLACEDTLWPELASIWLGELSAALPSTAFNFQIGTPQSMSNMLLRGVLDIAVMYNPEIRQGFRVEHIMDDRLILVSSEAGKGGVVSDDYVYTNWGPEFAMAHSRWYPEAKPPQLMMQVGASAPKFLMEHGKSTFLPYRIADDYVARGQLHVVKDSPSFPFPAYAVWTEKASPELREQALDRLRHTARNAPWIEIGH